MTLTQKERPFGEPLRRQITRLMKAFDRLKNPRRPLWKHVIGGVRSLHLVGCSKPQWNPHLHLLVSATSPHGCSFADLPWRSAWRQVTADSDQVDVKPVQYVADERWKVMNYIVKPPQENFANNADMMAEFLAETKRLRFVTTLGAWRGMPLTGARLDANGKRVDDVFTDEEEV